MLEDLIGDYRRFFANQVARLTDIGISVSGYPVSHLAFRTETLEEYLILRDRIESVSRANVENQWSGRPISKLLDRSLLLGSSHSVDLIELIPPVHRPGYPLGLEHIGFGRDRSRRVRPSTWGCAHRPARPGSGEPTAVCDVRQRDDRQVPPVVPPRRGHRSRADRSPGSYRCPEGSLFRRTRRLYPLDSISEGRTFDGFQHVP